MKKVVANLCIICLHKWKIENLADLKFDSKTSILSSNVKMLKDMV